MRVTLPLYVPEFVCIFLWRSEVSLGYHYPGVIPCVKTGSLTEAQGSSQWVFFFQQELYKLSRGLPSSVGIIFLFMEFVIQKLNNTAML